MDLDGVIPHLGELDDYDFDRLFSAVTKEDSLRRADFYLKDTAKVLKSAPFVIMAPHEERKYFKTIEENSSLLEKHNLVFQLFHLPLRLRTSSRTWSKDNYSEVSYVDTDRFPEWFLGIDTLPDADAFERGEFGRDGKWDDSGHAEGHAGLYLFYHPHPFPIDEKGDKVPKYVVVFDDDHPMGEQVTPSKANEMWAKDQDKDKGEDEDEEPKAKKPRLEEEERNVWLEHFESGQSFVPIW